MANENKKKLFEQITSSDRPDHRLVSRYLKEVATEVRQLPQDQLIAKVDVPAPRAFPGNKPEELASDVTALIQIDAADTDLLLREIISVAAGLEVATDDKQAWKQLLGLIDGYVTRTARSSETEKNRGYR